MSGEKEQNVGGNDGKRHSGRRLTVKEMDENMERRSTVKTVNLKSVSCLYSYSNSSYLPLNLTKDFSFQDDSEEPGSKNEGDLMRTSTQCHSPPKKPPSETSEFSEELLGCINVPDKSTADVLSASQLEGLKVLKMDIIRENEDYLREHPEITAMIENFTEAMLSRKPMTNYLSAAVNYFTRSAEVLQAEVKSNLKRGGFKSETKHDNFHDIFKNQFEGQKVNLGETASVRKTVSMATTPKLANAQLDAPSLNSLKFLKSSKLADIFECVSDGDLEFVNSMRSQYESIIEKCDEPKSNRIALLPSSQKMSRLEEEVNSAHE